MWKLLTLLESLIKNLKGSYPDFDRANEVLIRTAEQSYLDGLDFSRVMLSLLVSKDGYIMDTGNWENANLIAAVELTKKVKRHKLIWKLFFMLG